jgi:hypothetical protein
MLKKRPSTTASAASRILDTIDEDGATAAFIDAKSQSLYATALSHPRYHPPKLVKRPRTAGYPAAKKVGGLDTHGFRFPAFRPVSSSTRSSRPQTAAPPPPPPPETSESQYDHLLYKDIPVKNITQAMTERLQKMKLDEQRMQRDRDRIKSYSAKEFDTISTLRAKLQGPTNIRAQVNNTTDPVVKAKINQAALADFFASRAFAVLRTRIHERTTEDIECLARSLRSISAFSKLSDFLLQQLCSVMYFEEYDSGRVLFKQGDVGTSWYVILRGSVKVNVSATKNWGDSITGKLIASLIVIYAHCSGHYSGRRWVWRYCAGDGQAPCRNHYCQRIVPLYPRGKV